MLFNKKGDKFLLLKHPKRWDIAKGHTEKGETELQTAIREFEEETGIDVNDIKIFEEYRCEIKYETIERKTQKLAEKSLIVFLAQLTKKNATIIPTEHESYTWFDWMPPHNIQEKSINPILKYTEDFFMQKALSKLKKFETYK